MLYEMVTGRPPFVGDDNVAIIGQYLNTPPVSPSWHRPDLPKGLEALVLRLLEKDPNKRPASAAEVRQALASIALSPLPLGEGQGEGAPTNAPTTDNPLYRRTFVGREAELRQLQAAFDGAMSGQGALAMVVGEPGIGKTALVEQLATYASLRGGRTLVGHSYEEGSLSLPYLAFVEAMRSYVLAREPEALKSDLGTGVADVARIVSEIRDRVQVELRTPGDPEDDRWRLLQAVSGFLRNAAQVQPLLIVLEDLHWADRGTLDLLLHVARNLSGARLLIAGTYRDVEVDRSHPLSSALAELGRISTFGRVRLRWLTAEEVQRILSSLLTQDVQWVLAEAVHRQTEGNPLFVQEVVRYLAEEGLIAREGTRWRRTGDQPLAMAIPEGLRDVIGKRLSRLSPACNRLLAIAAVIGRDFNLATLRTVSALGEDELVTALEEATKVGVLEERSQPGAILYRFTHAFLRQTLYEELSAPRRLRLHQEVARALEAQYAERRQEHAAELAEHFAQSIDKADLAKAVEYGELAAQRAMSVFDYGEAARLLERAIDVQEVLDPDDKAKRCDLLLAFGEALVPAGEPQRAADEAAEEAYALAEALGDAERRARAGMLAIRGLNSYGAATATGTPAYKRWAAPGSREEAWASQAVASVRLTEGRYREASTLRTQAVTLARELGDGATLVRAATNAFVFASAAEEAERSRLLQGLVDGSQEGVRTLSNALLYAGSAWLMHGERDRAEALWREVAALADRTRAAGPMVFAGLPPIILATLDGRLEEALAATERAITLGDELGAGVRARLFANGQSGRALIWLGRAAEALTRVGEAAQLAGAAESLELQGQRALILAHLGERAQASALLRQLVDRLGDELEAANYGFILNLLEAAGLVGDIETAQTLVSALRPVAHLSSGFAWAGAPSRLLGRAAALLGKPDEARSYYLQALEACAKIRFRPEIALTRLQLAELLLEHYPHERADALAHLDFAITEFREMKMQPSLERALRHRGLLKA